MDLFTEASRSEQVHDFNPGIDSAGLFWTTEVAKHSVRVNPGAGRAAMSVRDLPVLDHFTIPNALFGGGPAPVPAVVSFDLRWSGIARRYTATSTRDRVEGRFVDSASATIEWSAREEGFSFVSTPGSSQLVFAGLGHERNGFFFR
jgi:hypothetical protein